MKILDQLDEIAIRSWLDSIVRTGHFSTSEVNVVFTSDEYLLALNKQFLNHDYYTDVITFEKNWTDGVRLEIYISVDRAKENAETEGVKLLKELLRLIIHGVLHSEGMKDKKNEEKRAMRIREDRAIEEYFKCFT